jgi:hypothetical protein
MNMDHLYSSIIYLLKIVISVISIASKLLILNRVYN